MNEQQQNQNLTFLDKLVGNQGIKTDITVRLPDEVYIKLGATVLLVGVLLLIAYYTTKSIIQ